MFDLYRSPPCGADDDGDAVEYLGGFQAQADDDGIPDMVARIDRELPQGHSIVGTATDEQGNTSELSTCGRENVGAISLEGVASPVPGRFNRELTYTFTVRNTDPGDPAQVLLVTDLPWQQIISTDARPIGSNCTDEPAGTVCFFSDVDSDTDGVATITIKPQVFRSSVSVAARIFPAAFDTTSVDDAAALSVMIGCSEVGTRKHDHLAGSTEDDILCGGSGEDRLIGYGGHDRLLGGSGADVLIGSLGTDRLRGQAGNDLLRGGKGDDFLYGGPHTDYCRDFFGSNVFSSCERGH